LPQTVHIIGTRASGYPSWPGVVDSTRGRIHWRRPSAILRFSLATLRRTIHSDMQLTGLRPDREGRKLLCAETAMEKSGAKMKNIRFGCTALPPRFSKAPRWDR